MEICKISESDIQDLIKFGKEVYPDRANYKNIVEFNFYNRIGDYSGGIILKENKRIVGQSLVSPVTQWQKGKNFLTGWGYDLIVHPELRKEARGVDLLLAIKREFPGICGTGAGPDAVALNKILKVKDIGYLHKFIGISSIITFPFKQILPINSFPDKIKDFKLIENPENVKYKDFFNFDLLEPGRSFEFLKWRFFSKDFIKYWFYQNDKGDYFILRPIKLKGIQVLEVADYRCQLQESSAFNEILSVIKKIANKVNLPIILIGSSHKTVDSILEKNHFKSIGRPRPIQVFPKFKGELDIDKINCREFTLITFGDSDGEWSW